MKELPKELLSSKIDVGVRSDRTNLTAKSQIEKPNRTPTTTAQGWKKGDRVVHKTFGVGEISHVFGSGNKLCIAVKFPSVGQKILDPKIAPLQKVQ